VFKAEAYTDVPHFAGKHTVERMIDALGLPATVLRPAYFIQNDLRQKDPLMNFGAYASPIGAKGISMVDIRDIGEAAAIELIRRERAPAPLRRETYALVGPDGLTGQAVAAIWTEALGRPLRYCGDHLGAMEQRLKTMLPAWYALDLRLMFSPTRRTARSRAETTSPSSPGCSAAPALLPRLRQGRRRGMGEGLRAGIERT
jgi:uncharacterized protein YbjT (DUF2867 family)